jgi:hypothetical protein
MAVARKSAVSATRRQSGRQNNLSSSASSWFRRDSTPNSLKSPSKSQGEPTPVPSRRQRRSSNNSSVSTRELGKQPTSNLNGQSNGVQRNQKVKNSTGAIPVMPNSDSAPVWLLRLYALHRHSSIVAFLLVAAMLVTYGWTVYSEQLWSQASRRLQNLQRQERQLTTTNEVIKNKMAVEAERPEAGLISPTPKGAIFLPRASHSPNQADSSATTQNSDPQQQTSSPLGY